MHNIYKKYIQKFQNLIGMLGRKFIPCIHDGQEIVSKPYRYARKSL